MAYDLGDVVTLSYAIEDTNGAPANAGAFTVTAYLPDGTTASFTVTNPSTGNYTATYTPTLAGLHGVRAVATGANAIAYPPDSFTVFDSALFPIVSIRDLKAHLNITSTTDDDELAAMLSVATEAAERYCNRSFRRCTIVETHDGDTDAICLWQSPVISVTSVTENGSALTGSDYFVDASAGILYRGSTLARYEWADGTQNIIVTYVAGATVPPLAAQHAVKELTRHLWDSQRGTVALPNVGGYDDGYSTAGGSSYTIPYRVRELLDPLRRPGLA